MLSVLSNAAYQLNNVRSENVAVERKCGFCRCSGHTIKDCKHPTKYLLRDRIMTVVAITEKFPFLKDLCIRKELELLTLTELKALSYRFERYGEMPKNKAGLIKSLTRKYYHYFIEKAVKYGHLVEPYLIKIYKEFQFDIRTPNRVPDSSALRRCADIAYENLPEDRVEYFKMTTWISQQIERHYKDYVDFKKSQEFTPHRFEIQVCICSSYEEDYQCPICLEEFTDEGVKLDCDHKYCTTCIELQLKTASKAKNFCHPNCAMCRAPIKDMWFYADDYGDSYADYVHAKYIKKDKPLINWIYREDDTDDDADDI